MPFKPGRKDPNKPDLDKLRTILNQTKTSQQNNPLYQFCNELLNALTNTRDKLDDRITALEKKVDDCCGDSTDISSESFLTWE